MLAMLSIPGPDRHCGLGVLASWREIKESRYDGNRKQLLTYLRLADKRLGLLIHFNSSMGWKKNLTPSRKDAKKTREVEGLVLSV
jgi:hypothetical protein